MSVAFVGNFAEIGGAALYISDIRGCFWFDSSFDVDERYTIFNPPPNTLSPFTFRYVCTYIRMTLCKWYIRIFESCMCGYCVGVYAMCKGCGHLYTHYGA